MNCTHARMLLHLDLPDERSPHEQRLLDVHLQRCVICRSEQQRLEASAGALRQVTSAVPAQTDPDRSLARILALVSESPQLQTQCTGQSESTATIFRIATSATLPMTIAATLLLVLGGFLFQTWTVQREVAALERQVRGDNLSPANIRVGFLIDTGALRNMRPDTVPFIASVADDQLLFLTRDEVDALFKRAEAASRYMHSLSDSLVNHAAALASEAAEPAISLRIVFTGV